MGNVSGSGRTFMRSIGGRGKGYRRFYKPRTSPRSLARVHELGGMVQKPPPRKSVVVE